MTGRDLEGGAAAEHGSESATQRTMDAETRLSGSGVATAARLRALYLADEMRRHDKNPLPDFLGALAPVEDVLAQAVDREKGVDVAGVKKLLTALGECRAAYKARAERQRSERALVCKLLQELGW